MKSARSILKIFILVVTANIAIFANNVDKIINTKEDLKTYVVELTNGFDSSVLNGKKEKAKIQFVLRPDGEIILLATGAKNKDLHNHIKSRVNRTYVTMGEIKPGNYTIDVKF